MVKWESDRESGWLKGSEKSERGYLLGDDTYKCKHFPVALWTSSLWATGSSPIGYDVEALQVFSSQKLDRLEHGLQSRLLTPSCKWMVMDPVAGSDLI